MRLRFVDVDRGFGAWDAKRYICPREVSAHAAHWLAFALGLILIAAGIVTVGQIPGAGDDQPPVSPETLGFSAERLQRLDRSLQQVADKEFAGMVTILTRHGKGVYSKTIGKQDLEKGVPMQKDSIGS